MKEKGSNRHRGNIQCLINQCYTMCASNTTVCRKVWFIHIDFELLLPISFITLDQTHSVLKNLHIQYIYMLAFPTHLTEAWLHGDLGNLQAELTPPTCCSTQVGSTCQSNIHMGSRTQVHPAEQCTQTRPCTCSPSKNKWFIRPGRLLPVLHGPVLTCWLVHLAGDRGQYGHFD